MRASTLSVGVCGGDVQPGPWRHDHSSNRASNRPSLSRFTTSATASQPRTLLPAEFNFGEKAATASRAGHHRHHAPPTPLLAGTPTV